MSAVGVWYDSSEEKKHNVCVECKKKSSELKAEFGFNDIFIDDYLTETDLLLASEISESASLINWTELMFENIPIGNYASYEFLLNRKISSTKFDVSLLPEYKAALFNSLITAMAAKKINQFYSPNRVISYNNLYSCNHIFSAISSAHGSSVYSLHAGSHHKYRLSEMTIFRDYIHQSLTNRTEAWQEYSSRPIGNKQIKRAYEHIEELLEAKSPWVYSVKSNSKSADDIKSKLNVPQGAKVILAMMASGDERFGAAIVDALPPYETPFFETQLDWIEFLIKLAEERSDFYLIIRVHPREFPNKREKILSTQAKVLLNAFNKLPSNVIVNWPDDNISLHDLVKIVDVGLNATSTAGLELLMFGVPVVVYDSMQLFSYPREFNYVAISKDDYIAQIERALSDGISFKHIVNVFRWLSYRSDIVAIDISRHYKVNRNLLMRMFNRFLRILNINIFDSSFNRWSFCFGVKNKQKLVYAIENNQISHIGFFNPPADLNLDLEVERERKYLMTLAEKYFKKIGLRFERVTIKDAEN
jgi:hypothetical protein